MQTNDVQRAVAAIQHFPSPIPPDSPFLRALGTTAALKAPPQTDTLAQRALEEWKRTLCGGGGGKQGSGNPRRDYPSRPTNYNPQMVAEMLIAIVLDRPLAEAIGTG